MSAIFIYAVIVSTIAFIYEKRTSKIHENFIKNKNKDFINILSTIFYRKDYIDYSINKDKLTKSINKFLNNLSKEELSYINKSIDRGNSLRFRDLDSDLIIEELKKESKATIKNNKDFLFYMINKRGLGNQSERMLLSEIQELSISEEDFIIEEKNNKTINNSFIKNI